mmetsp:Transcript_24137/g.69454  ORF Transcript_24137/g.69454 Transcript_24137/m.69454 type:complete len:93 (-) Transcript_24137:90-368(-)
MIKNLLQEGGGGPQQQKQYAETNLQLAGTFEARNRNRYSCSSVFLVFASGQTSILDQSCPKVDSVRCYAPPRHVADATEEQRADRIYRNRME